MHTLTLADTQIAYYLDGPADGPPIVLINSLGANWRMWDAQTALLSQTRRVIRYDARGHGGSASGAAAELTLDRLGQDLIALLDHLAIPRADLCGLSLGGITALWLAIHQPQRVRRAIFANTAARIGSVETWQTRIEQVRQGGMAAVRDAALGRFFSPAFRAAQPAVAAVFSATLTACDPQGYIACCAALRDADLRPEIAAIRCPALVIGAALDQSTPPAQAEELHHAIAGSQLMIFPETAHLSNVEQLEAFNAHLHNFLNS